MIKGISNNSTLLTSISSEKNSKTEKSDKMEKSRVESIKDAIQNGTYKIDIEKASVSMAKQLL
jgi:anti-sigma28 factor (negative regulator of flagellin synthesis)